MWWRVPRGGKLWEKTKGESNRKQLKALVESGKIHAVLALDGGAPIGWCCFGPRHTFPRLETVKAIRRETTPETWSITCFYVAPGRRARGLGAALLDAATELAFAAGARELEGYPVVPQEPRRRMPDAFAWTGVPAMFQRAGYHDVSQAAASRRYFVLDSADRVGSAKRRKNRSTARRRRPAR